MGPEAKSQPKDMPEIRTPKAEIEEMMKLQMFNVQAHIDTYTGHPDHPEITAEWITGHLMESLTGEDAPDLSTPEGIAGLEAEYAEKFADPDQLWRIAADADGNVVGMMFALRKPYPEDHPRAGQTKNHLEAFFISPDHQGKGLGREFMGELETWRDPQLDTTLEVTTFTPDAIAIYEHYGFEKVAGEDHLYKDKMPMHNMVYKGVTDEV